MTDDDLTGLAHFGAMLICLHAISEAADLARQVSDDLYRRELLSSTAGLPIDSLPNAKDLMYEAPID